MKFIYFSLFLIWEALGEKGLFFPGADRGLVPGISSLSPDLHFAFLELDFQKLTNVKADASHCSTAHHSTDCLAKALVDPARQRF